MKAKLFISFVLFLGPLMAQISTPKAAFLEKWENSKNYLITIAEAMPEEAYDFKPTERQWSFEKQLFHIKDNMDWLSTTYFSSRAVKPEKVSKEVSKTEILALLIDAFNNTSEIVKNTSDESLSETVDFFAGPKSKLQILNLLQDHVTHHRGQLIVYLNLKNVEPPKYVGW